jgi:hypothetical protein
MDGYGIVSSVATGAANSTTVTAGLTAAAGTLGRGSTSVPVQVGSATQGGFITSGGDNRVEIWDAATKAKLQDASGNEVYGRLTESAGAYTLSYYSAPLGVETAYAFAVTTNVSYSYTYRFEQDKLPENAFIKVPINYASNDPVAAGLTKFRQQTLTPTAQNVLPALTTAYNSTNGVFQLVVNGITYTLADGISIVGTAVTWTAATTGFNLETTDKVYAYYTV